MFRINKYIFSLWTLLVVIIFHNPTCAQQKDSIYFTLSIDKPALHLIHVSMDSKTGGKDSLIFKMPQWTPGYYQIMNYGDNVINFSAKDSHGSSLIWNKINNYTWVVKTLGTGNVVLNYDVVAKRAFVANSFTDSAHAYITPASAFLYIDKHIQTPVSLVINSYKGWSRVATGLDSLADKIYSYTAPDFDVLYDCPILAGNLEELSSFTVKGISHRFIGYQLGDFDKTSFMHDMKRIVETAVSMMGDIPYKHYTFLGIGHGRGGIEHLTSSANSFNGSELNTEDGRKRMLSFLAHEYFHNYNVKRVRPIELGPFNYDSGSKTRQLWIAEGWTVYYEYMILRRAGIMNDTDLYSAFRKNILAYETHNSRHMQSLAQASAETWSDGPFGNDPEKTISYYDKGPIVALMLDFAIRHYTNNKKSLDDVMRRLYNEFYKQKKRGFTETELRSVCKKIAGNPLTEIFNYVYTTNELNYKKYFNYGGLDIDTSGRSFTINPSQHPNALQEAIRQSWVHK